MSNVSIAASKIWRDEVGGRGADLERVDGLGPDDPLWIEIDAALPLGRGLGGLPR